MVVTQQSFNGNAVDPRFDEETMLAQLRAEFIEDAGQRLERMQAAVDQLAKTPEDPAAVVVIRREAHSIKGMSGSVGFHSLTLYAHRLEDFLRHALGVTSQFVDDLQLYFDTMAAVLAARAEPSAETVTQALQKLPIRIGGFDPNAIDRRHGEALVVTQAPMVSKILGRELGGCGFRAITVSDPFEAIAMAARLRPTCVLTSAVLGAMSGADVVRALAAIRATQAITVGLVTSLTGGKVEIADLPPGTSVLRFGRDLQDDLGAFLAKLPLDAAAA
ncbi:MAG: hypothetical protein FJX57_03850 [Alphaproteobacteria bacterium]|nr:hypothetical protein [Alphaproteobacteria bacterium]